ncbi:MAG TPA: DUF305 domain-containing protein [Allosphingosinicella sp.]|nr:DUF305 domain-containing protein [Allosphingosinicella sp.]
MHSSRRSSVRPLLRGSAALLAISVAFGAMAQTVPIVQPGAPGQGSTILRPEEAARTADTRVTQDDIRFMQDMIGHHRQAVAMTALVSGRTTRADVVQAARRIDASQEDEIRFMEGWLRERGAPLPAAGGGHAGHGGAGAGQHGDMPGMATAGQMAALAAARGTAFDRLFLARMIAHHEGAVTMARALLAQPNSATDPVLFEFVNDVIAEQQGEITRMTAVLAGLADDPRTALAAGLTDAGQAIRNMRLVASLPKPVGFFDPANPGGLPRAAPAAAGGAAARPAEDAAPRPFTEPDQPVQPAAQPAAGQPAAGQTPPAVDRREPAARLSFANTDMAFSGDLLAVGSYHGFNLYRLLADAPPRLVSSVICPGGQGDVSLVGNLLIMSVEQTSGRVDCGRQGVTGNVSSERFRGLRIFDVSDPARPVQVGQVQTCRGSHTHSVVSGPGQDGTIVVYNSGTSSVRSDQELAGCLGDVPDDRTALFRIDVIEIPVADPSRARIVDSPAVFSDAETGRLAGLWRGGTHGEGTQETRRTDQCHDITVFPSRNLAAGACSGNGIILDISDPRRPRRIDAALDPNFAYWHSATFNNDGTKVLFTDEWGGGARPRCRAQDPRAWGANAIYDIVDNRLQFRSHQKLPAAQGERENCVAHNGSIVPVPGRDIFVQAWYQGGISVIDFTDSANPVEIAFFDRGPISADHLVLGGHWSAYFYNGRIYGSEIVRGLDVLALTPSEHLTANEIAAAALADQGGRFNPQQQFPTSWPHDPVVARAYLDQLQRSRAVPASTIANINRALYAAAAPLAAGRADPSAAGRLDALAAALRTGGGASPAGARRIEGLRATLRGLAARLR